MDVSEIPRNGKSKAECEKGKQIVEMIRTFVPVRHWRLSLHGVLLL